MDVAQRFQLEGLIQEHKYEVGHFEDEQKGYPEPGKMDPGVLDIAIESHGSPMKTKKVIAMESSNFENTEELDQKIDDMNEKREGSRRRCIPCGKISSNITHARDHAETHIDGLSFPCQYCNKSFRSRTSYRIHITHRCHQRQ